MIKEICIDSLEVRELEDKFPQVFGDKKIKEDFLNNPFSKYLVYIADNQVVGFLNYTLVYDRIEIVNINILDLFKRRGIASSLIKKMLEIAEENKVVNITLEVNKDNQAAINLYEKFGFVNVAIRKSYYNGVDGILMEKR